MSPIILTDPAKNPRTSSMLLNCAAIWEVDPASTKFAEFPKLWQDGIALIQAYMQMIFQTMNVNPAMLPQRTGSRKPNQAEIAAEQTVDLLTTGVAVSAIEHTGHSDDSHSPDAWASVVVRRMRLPSLSIAVICTVAISWPPSALRTMSRPLDSAA